MSLRKRVFSAESGSAWLALMSMSMYLMKSKLHQGQSMPLRTFAWHRALVNHRARPRPPICSDRLDPANQAACSCTCPMWLV